MQAPVWARHRDLWGGKQGRREEMQRQWEEGAPRALVAHACLWSGSEKGVRPALRQRRPVGLHSQPRLRFRRRPRFRLRRVRMGFLQRSQPGLRRWGPLRPGVRGRRCAPRGRACCLVCGCRALRARVAAFSVRRWPAADAVAPPRPTPERPSSDPRTHDECGARGRKNQCCGFCSMRSVRLRNSKIGRTR